MKNIKNIFFSDMHSLIRNLYVLIIALGLCCLPALYAWFNIYSNWDPYGNTGNIKIAIASKDSGYTDAHGKQTNAGEGVLASLKENKAIHWVFTSAKDVEDGVYRGDYYAGLVLSKDFSTNMYDGFLQGLKRPLVTYYENEKKNAVATKITDTAVSNLQNSINQMYISILVSNVFEKETTAIDKIEEKNTITTLQHKVRSISNTIKDYSSTTASFVNANTKLSASLDSAKGDLKKLEKSLSSKDISEYKQVAEPALPANLLQKGRQILQLLSSAELQLSKIRTTDAPALKAKYYQKAVTRLNKAQKQTELLVNAVNQLPADTKLQTYTKQLLTKLQTSLDTMEGLHLLLIERADSTEETQTQASDKKALLEEIARKEYKKTLSSLTSRFQSTILPYIEEIAELTDTLQKDITSSLKNITEDLVLLQQIFTGTNDSLDSATDSLKGLSAVLLQTSEDLETIDTAIGSVSESEWLQQALSFMQGDPEGYGAFFAAPIKIKSERIYPVENYGSGVTPFYTTLAIWVGGIFLVSMIKVTPNRKKFPDARPHELFLGRFILFFLLGQLQTLIIVIGNLSLLHTQCLHPKHFWFACAAASLTFLLLIYAFTVSFGDVGKALIVVFVVLQIAGSSGTYPIEILPEYYQKIYTFFPFPYAINAMREAICGLNGNDYYIYLFQLLLFAVAALLLGLGIRLPFQKLTHFMERRMEDTGLM